MKYLPIGFIVACILVACQSEPKVIEYSHIPEAFSVEISVPAGMSTTKSFLPTPGNLAYSSKDNTLAVLVLAESQKIGINIPVRPIGALQFKEKEQLKNIIIATPIDTAIQLTSTTSFREFIAENAGEKQIIQDWFLYEIGLGNRQLVGWEDEAFALSLVKGGQ